MGDEETETKTNETTVLWKRARKRAIEGGKIKGLGSYGKYGHASNGTEGDKRRQKVSTRVHAG